MRFDAFLVDLDALEVRRDGEVVRLEPQVFDLIAFLCANPGRVIGHDEMVEHVWHGRIVSDSTIATRINAARRALGDDGTAQRIIKTVRGRGYRLEVKPVSDVTGGRDATGAVVRERFVLSCTPHAYSLLMTTRGEAPPNQDWRQALPEALSECAGQHAALECDRGTAVFADAADAVRCAGSLVRTIAARCETLVEADRWRPKIGIGHGEDNGNCAYARACRLDALAPPGAICISGHVRDRVAGRIDLIADELKTTASGEDAFKVTRIDDLALTDAQGINVPQTMGFHIPEAVRTSVVVMPFATIGGEREVEDTACGLRLEIQNALTQLSGVTPIAAGTAMAFAGSTSPEVAAVLGVRYVVQGNVRAIGRSARLMIELYDHRRGGVSFSHSYDGSLDDGFDFQDEMTARVLAALDVHVLSGEQARVWHKSYRSIKAIQLQYRGMHEFFRMSKVANRAARECFERLHALRPDISIGATWVSLCHWFELQRGWAEDRTASIAAVKKWASIAIGMDDADGQAHTALCHTHMLEHEFDKALEIGESAVTVRPSCANANGFYAHALYYCGLPDKAEHHAKLAIRFSPAYPLLFAVVLSGALHAQGDNEGSISIAKELLRLEAHDPLVRVILASALMDAGRSLEAGAVAAEMHAADTRFDVDAFLDHMPFRRVAMRNQLSRNFTRARPRH